MRGALPAVRPSRASNAEVHKQIDTSTQSLKDALGRFQRMVDHFDHPKVSTTVGRVFANYLQGRKTLVFCERVPTVHEISEAVRQRIEAHWGGYRRGGLVCAGPSCMTAFSPTCRSIVVGFACRDNRCALIATARLPGSTYSMH